MTHEQMRDYINQSMNANCANGNPVLVSQMQAVLPIIDGTISLRSNKQKGNCGEIMADLFFAALDCEALLLKRVQALDDLGHHGIDGIYKKIVNGTTFYIISDAKYNTSRLRKTRDGKQLSDGWIDCRLNGKSLNTGSRLISAVGAKKAKQIIYEIQSGKAFLIRVCIHIDPNLNVSARLVDRVGTVIFKDIDL